MDYLSNLENQKSQYETLNSDLNNAANLLLQSYNTLEYASQIGNYFSVDDASIDSGSIDLNRRKILDCSQFLSNHIASVIGEEITKINQNIEAEKQRQEEEKRRQEEAARQQEAAKKQQEEAARQQETAKKQQETTKQQQVSSSQPKIAKKNSKFTYKSI